MLTEPEDRIAMHQFDNQQSYIAETIVSGGPFDFPSVTHSVFRPTEMNETIMSKDANYRIIQAEKIVAAERERIERHRRLRSKQLEIEEEIRVR